MSIDYNVVERGQPGVVGGGEKKFYAQIVYGKEATVDELVKNIEISSKCELQARQTDFVGDERRRFQKSYRLKLYAEKNHV